MAPAKKIATAAQGEIDDEQRLQSLYYRAVFKKRKVTLFTRTHYKILQALYSSSSSFSSLPPRSSSITTIWPLIESFLKDQRELMSQQAYLDRVYAAAPWLVPSPAATIANAPSSSSSSSLGWRVTRRLLHEQLIHEEDRYNQQCRRHHPLLMAIGNEIRRLSPSPASGDAAAGAGACAAAAALARAVHPPLSFISSSSSSPPPSPLNEHHQYSPSSPASAAAPPGPPSIPPSLLHHPKEDPLEIELRHLDSAASMENKLHLWARLHTVVYRTITLEGGGGGGEGWGGGRGVGGRRRGGGGRKE
ncbi:hypothetical protein VYU27_005749 [Nannochloropsis oceanica]